MKPTALILDLGNVLVFHDNRLLFARFGERAGLSADEVQRRLYDETLWVAANRGQLAPGEIRRRACQALGIALEPSEFDALWCCHFRPNAPMFPLVEALAGRVKLLLLSNTNPIHLAYLRETCPVLGRFHPALYSCELGLVKPEPAIYQAALRAAGERPERTAFFDDDPGFVEAAHREGIQAQVFTGAEDFRRQLAVWELLG